MAFMGWTVPIIWAALVLFAALTVLLLYLGLFQDRSRGRPRCPKCWYNMTGAPSLVCPECGHDARNPRRLHRTRRRRWAIVLAVLTAFCCYCSWLVRVRFVELKEPIAVALRPTSYLLATLPKAQVAQVFILRTRAGRFGFWPWESELLLLTIDPILSVKGPFWEEAIWLLSMAAQRSNRAIAKLFDLREFVDPDPDFPVYPALRFLAEYTGRLRDDQLSSVLDSAMRLCQLPNPATERILTEMIRRNRPAFRDQIAHWAANPPVSRTFRNKQNLELLTALRRMDCKPDPLHVFVSGPQTIECSAASLPTLEVIIRNVDNGKEAVDFQFGGNYYGGRHDRWRFEVRNEQGRLWPERSSWSHRNSGSSYSAMLEFGRSYEVRLVTGQYIEPLVPGRYRVRVLYHNHQSIAQWSGSPAKRLGARDMSRLILFSSDPFELIVKPGGPDSRPADGGK